MLNERLYDALCQIYPRESIQVKHENQVADIRRVQKVIVTRLGAEKSVTNYEFVRGGKAGEKYVFNCPFCGDTKRRFSVSYLFNQRDPVSKRRHAMGLHCFNETACHTVRDNREELLEKIQLQLDWGVVYSAPDSDDIDEDAMSGNADMSVGGEVSLPGVCTPLRELPESHPAIEYLISRGIDPWVVANAYNVSFVEKPYRWSILQGRLLIPFYRTNHGQVYVGGWTARSIGGDDYGRKYFNSPGSMAGYIYGLQSAVQCEVPVVVEGPLDRWVVGHSSMALLTSKIGQDKQQRLSAGLNVWAEKWRAAYGLNWQGLVVVLLDPLQSEAAAERGFAHPMLEAVKAVESCLMGCPLGTTVLPVWLPKFMDPGAAHAEYLASYLRSYLRDKGYERLGQVLARDVLSSSAAGSGFSRSCQVS